MSSVKGADNDGSRLRGSNPVKVDNTLPQHIMMKLLFKNFHRSTISNIFTYFQTPFLLHTHTNIMPSFAESLGLGALTSWLSGSSKTKTDTVGSSAEPKKHAKPSKVRTITISSDMLEGKTFEEAMAAVPFSVTDSEETDELADELEATTLSENTIPDSGTGSHSQTECENAGGTPIKNAALQNSSNLEPGSQCCGGAFQTENAVTKVMKAAGSLGLGSTEYFE